MLLKVFSERGWLSTQPPVFQAAVLRACAIRALASGTVIYNVGETSDGAYAVAQGAVALSLDSAGGTVRVAQLVTRGDWFGRTAFLTGEPRRLTARTWCDSTLLHLPLAAMEDVGRADLENVRRFTQLAMERLDTAHRAISDLMIPAPMRRIAAALAGSAGMAGRSALPMTQQELGVMANTSRKLVNQILAHFERLGWVGAGYRQIEVLDPRALRNFADEVDGPGRPGSRRNAVSHPLHEGGARSGATRHPDEP